MQAGLDAESQEISFSLLRTVDGIQGMRPTEYSAKFFGLPGFPMEGEVKGRDLMI
jgi:hypothetical protein